MLGDMTLAEALRLALNEGLDLVEVNPGARPPVCKLLDFSKYTYEAAKNAAQERCRNEQDDET
jgi:translation initiation factor IF-3